MYIRRTMKILSSIIALLSIPVFTQGVDPFGPRQKLGDVGSSQITEASGLAASRIHPNVLYTHNDKGDSSRFFAIDRSSGRRLATFDVRNAANWDWEDIAVGPCADYCMTNECSVSKPPSSYCVYLADTGDHNGDGAKNNIYMVREPNVLLDSNIYLVSTLKFRWTETDAESLMVSPAGQLYIVSKVDGGKATFAELPTEGWSSRTDVNMSQTATLQIKTTKKDPQGGDISPDGKEMVIVCEEELYYYSVPAMDYVNTVATKRPDKVSSYIAEPLTECVAWAYDGKGVYVLPEGKNKHIYWYPKVSVVG